jgi:outer membrane protein OmpA-like peptidoglycan-associated protein
MGGGCQETGNVRPGRGIIWGGRERGHDLGKNILGAALLLLLCAGTTRADVFRFAYTKGEKYRILSTVEETVIFNGRMDHKSDILNKVSAEVVDTRGGAGLHKVLFQTSERAFGSGGTYEWSEDYTSEFWRDGRGAYEIDAHVYMPVVRDVPLFPEGDVSVGQTWTAPGSEVHDLRRGLSLPEAFHFPLTASYSYLRNEKRGGVDCAVISAAYDVFYKVPDTPRGVPSYPTRISGSSRQTLWWDRENRRLQYAEEDFDLVLTLASRDEFEFTGRATGELIEAAPLDREKVTRDIQQRLREKKVEGATVRPVPEGVAITIENVNFPPNSDSLMPAEQEKLRRITEILREYPDRDIMVTGHTAGVPGYTPQQHQALSEQRARAAGNFLLSLKARRADQMSMRGMGDRAPVADNSTEEGRKKNRRVEITILEN